MIRAFCDVQLCFQINDRRSPSCFPEQSAKPQRITITISWSVYQRLLAVSNEQGRSLSNTAAYWLERQSEVMQRKAA